MDLRQLPPPALEILSYNEGTAQANQLNERIPEAQRGDFVSGFRDAVASALNESAMLYAAGGHSARQAMEQGLDAAKMLAGMEDKLAGKAGAYSEDELHAAFAAFQELQSKAGDSANGTSAAQGDAAGNLQTGRSFLAENARRDEVTTTDSGLQYTVLQEAAGPKPAATDEVTVHYRGRLLNGQEFDSSYQRGEPTSFPLNRVIPGWTEGLQLMSVGATYRFWIPAHLAYGEQAPPVIGPNQVLDFEVELLKIG